MTGIRWDFFDLAVSSAQRVVPDPDVAREVALVTLHELDATATAALVVTRARSRAKDAARAHARRPPVYNEDMDALRQEGDPTFELAAAREAQAQLTAAIGADAATLLTLKAEGFTNADIAAMIGRSEETVRLRVAKAEQARTNLEA